MKQTDLSKKLLNIAVAISLVVCSFALLVYSIKNNKASASPSPSPAAVPVGLVMSGGQLYIIGYDKTQVLSTDKVSVLASIPFKQGPK